MTKTSIRATAALGLAIALLMPARSMNARDKEVQQLAADVRMLQEQSQQLQNLLGQLSEALKAVNQRLDEQGRANVKAFADQKLTIDPVSRDLTIVREKLDDTNTRVGVIGEEVEALRKALQQQAVARQTSADATDPAAPAGTPPPAQELTAAAAPPLGLSPQKMYDQARNDYSVGLYDLAIKGFEAFIRTFPRSDLADDAQVDIGNAYLQDGKNDRALEAYETAIRTYPSGNAIPDAYFKKGVALQNLRQTAAARESWDYLVKTYPQSTAALLARQRLLQSAPPAR